MAQEEHPAPEGRPPSSSATAPLLLIYSDVTLSAVSFIFETAALSLLLQARGRFISKLKEFHSKPAEHNETIRQTYFLFSNGEAGLTVETHLSAPFKTRVT